MKAIGTIQGTITQLILLMLAGAAGAPAWSRPPEPLPSTLREEIVVTASRMRSKYQDVMGSVTVLTRDDILQSAARTLDDFLRQVPGFSLFRRSSSIVAHPTTQGVTLRGISPSGVSRTLVLIDGVPANDSFGGWVAWGRIPLESVERVEILRGGGSSVWGNYALGGVINVVTRGIEDGEIALAAQVGNQNDLDLDLYAGQRYDRLGWSLGGNFFQTDGYGVVRRDQRGPIDVNAYSEHLYLNPKIEYHASPQSRFSLQAVWFDEKRGNGTPLTNNETRAGRIDAVGEFESKGGSEWRVALFAHDQTFSSTFSAQAPDRLSERPALDQFAVDSLDVGLSTQWTKTTSSINVLSIGSDLRRIDGRTNENFFWTGSDFQRLRRAGGEQTVVGLFLQDRIAVSDSVDIALSARFDYWQNTGGFRIETDRGTGSVLRSNDFDDRDASVLSPKLAVLYRASERVSMRGSLYRSFRAPTINELYRPFRVRNDITEANAGLDAETLTGAELGFDFTTTTVHGRFTGFWNRVDNPIANVTLANVATSGIVAPCGFVPAGGSCRQRRNLDASRILGFEAALEIRPSVFWDLSASYLYSDGEVIEAAAQPDLEGKSIAQAPRHQLSLSVGYDHPRRFGARVLARYVSEQFEDDRNERVLDRFTVYDLSVWKRLLPDLQLFLGVENLLDTTYDVAVSGAGLVTIGAPRRIHGGIRWRAHR